MKKLIAIFLVLIIISPSFSFASGSYKVINTKKDPETGKEEVKYQFEVEYQGIVPCGKCLNVKSGNPEYQDVELQRCGANKKFIPCQLCHLFILISEVIRFFYSEIFWPLLGVLITILGFLLLLSEIHPVAFVGEETQISAIEKVKEGTKLTAFGFFFLLALWFLLNFFFTVIGVAEWTGLKNWFKISCTIKELPLAPLAKETELPPTVLGCPVNGGKINSTCDCRFHPVRDIWKMHTGVDIVSSDRRIFSVGEGEVIFVGQRGGYGNVVEIKLNNGYIVRYAHLDSFNVSRGQKVDKATQIGIMGNTGIHTGGKGEGIHLHFEVIDPKVGFLNPENFIGHCNYPHQGIDPKRHRAPTCDQRHNGGPC